MVISVLLRHTVDALIVRKSITIHMFIHTQSLRISIILVSVPAYTRDGERRRRRRRRWQCNYARSSVSFFSRFSSLFPNISSIYAAIVNLHSPDGNSQADKK